MKKGTVIAFMIAGLVIAIFSVVAVVKNHNTDFGTVEATIVRIEEEYDSAREEYDHHVFVDYEVDGVEYKDAEYGEYWASMKTGDKVTAKYDIDNPEHVQSEHSEIVPYVTGVAGFAIFAFALFKLIKGIENT